MDKRYKHLDGEERGVILAEHRGEPAGDRLVVGPRAEHDRAGTGAGAAGRCADLPQVARSVQDARRLLCRPRAKLVQGSRLHDWVRGKLLHQRWSPEQIAARLRAMHPDDPAARVSHETIYAAICAQAEGSPKAG